MYASTRAFIYKFKGRPEEPTILQVAMAHGGHVSSQHSFGRPLRMSGMYRTQSDHTPMDHL